MTTSRRTLVLAAGAGAAGLLVSGTAQAQDRLQGPTYRLAADQRPTAASGPLPSDPFTLGVASGDPAPDGFVLWTRLALDPLADDGLGGMPTRRVPLVWEVSPDPSFRRISRHGVVTAGPETAHAVHVEVTGLWPGREYYYRFRTSRFDSRLGRALTSPSPTETPGSLAMAFTSCAQLEHGWFTAYRHLAEGQPDLVLHLGDYQYEYAKDTYVAPSGNVRDHDGPETVTLANYRQRHAQYKTDEDLQRAHATAPWLVVFDDHEVDNNWADETPEHPEDQPGFRARRAAAFRAYYENMPLRRTSIPRGPDIQVYRRLQWGRLASFHMLDTRQFRDDQACGDGYKSCPAAGDPRRSITGDTQERWLADGFRRSRARWDLIGQQVFFAQRDADQGPVTLTSMDAWDGYTSSRDRIQRSWVRAGVRNPVVLTGDVHAHWASDLKADYADPDSAVIGSELITSSVTSTGDGTDQPSGVHPWSAWNPQLKFWTDLRGYVATRITRDALDADFRVVPKVSVQDEPVFSRARFRIEDRQRGLQQLTNTPVPASAGARSFRGRSPAEISRETLIKEAHAATSSSRDR